MESLSTFYTASLQVHTANDTYICRNACLEIALEPTCTLCCLQNKNKIKIFNAMCMPRQEILQSYTQSPFTTFLHSVMFVMIPFFADKLSLLKNIKVTHAAQKWSTQVKRAHKL